MFPWTLLIFNLIFVYSVYTVHPSLFLCVALFTVDYPVEMEGDSLLYELILIQIPCSIKHRKGIPPVKRRGLGGETVRAPIRSIIYFLILSRLSLHFVINCSTQYALYNVHSYMINVHFCETVTWK